MPAGREIRRIEVVGSESRDSGVHSGPKGAIAGTVPDVPLVTTAAALRVDEVRDPIAIEIDWEYGGRVRERLTHRSSRRRPAGLAALIGDGSRPNAIGTGAAPAFLHRLQLRTIGGR